MLLRLGRCLHKLDKRNAAITAYQDVVDHFPDDARYAGAALYHIGECHDQNGDESKQTAVWGRIVRRLKAADVRVAGMEGSGDEMTKLHFQVARFGDVAAELFKQRQLWDDGPKPEQTAFDLLALSLDGVRNKREDSSYPAAVVLDPKTGCRCLDGRSVSIAPQLFHPFGRTAQFRSCLVSVPP